MKWRAAVAALSCFVVFAVWNKHDGNVRIPSYSYTETKLSGSFGSISEPVVVFHPSKKIKIQFFLLHCVNFTRFYISSWWHMRPQQIHPRSKNSGLRKGWFINGEAMIRTHFTGQNDIINMIPEVGGGGRADIIHSRAEFEFRCRRNNAESIIDWRRRDFPRWGDLNASALTHPGCFSLNNANSPQSVRGYPESECKKCDDYAGYGNQSILIYVGHMNGAGKMQSDSRALFDEKDWFIVKCLISLIIFALVYAILKRL